MRENINLEGYRILLAIASLDGLVEASRLLRILGFAEKRLQLSSVAMSYWELHIREDERHGQWMLTDVALPLVDMYPEQVWELVLGYDQEQLIGDRASAAVISLIQKFSSGEAKINL